MNYVYRYFNKNDELIYVVILKTGKPYKTHYSKYKYLEGMTIKEVQQT